jgi:hypothetical protein
MFFGGADFASLPCLDNAHQQFRMIGSNTTRNICVDEGSHGRVVSFNAGRVERFMNSSVEQLAVCLTTYKATLGDRTSLTWDQRGAVEAAAVSKLKAVDVAAFADGDYFWPIAFEQLRV